MDVIKQTEDVIELSHTPFEWALGLGTVVIILFVGLIKALAEGALEGILISLAMLGVLSWLMITRIIRRLRVIADRGTGNIRISATTLRGEGFADYPLSALLRAEVETRHDGGNSTPEQRLVLVMGDESPTRRIQLDPFRPDPADLLYASQRINAWLAAGVRENLTQSSE